jgi:hypothetical protein
MDLLRAINPFARSTTAEQALDASRSATLALFLGAVLAVVAALIMMTAGADSLRAVSVAVAEEYGLEGRGKMIADLTVAMMFGFAVFQGLLGVYHWRHPGTILPIIALIVVAWGIVQSLLQLSGMTTDAGSFGVLKLITMVVQVLLFASAIRGGNTLDRIRKAQGVAPAPSAD